MKAKNSTILIALCAIMMLASSVISGCGGGEEYKAKYSYVSVPGRIEIMASADEQSRWMDGYETHSERADYCFQTSVSDRLKDEFVDTAEQVLRALDMNGVRFIAGTSVGTAYVPDVNNAINTVQKEVDAVYFNIEDLSHHNIMIQLNAKRFGKEMPYGLLYAYSYLICKENGFAVPQSPADEQSRAVIEQNQGLSDLNVFVFLSAFTTEEQKAAAKWLAIKTADTFGAEKLGEIMSAGDVREAAYNFDLLTRQVCYDSGITTRLGLSSTDWLFFRTQKYLVARSLETGVRFFIEPDYRRLNDEMNTYMKDYADLAAYFAASVDSFEKINEFIGNEQFLPSDFYFSNDYEMAQAFGHFSIMRSYLDTAHEYTHMAMREKGRSDIFNTWTVEGIASYLGNMMSDYPTEFLLYALQRYIGSGDIMADRVYALIADGKAPDKTALWDIFGYAYECEYPGQDPHHGTWRVPDRKAPSFCNYLIENYGKDNFMKLCTQSFTYETDFYGKTLSQLREEWFLSLKQRYE